MLITVSDRGDNKGQWAPHSLIKWLTSTTSILSLVVLISLNFLYDMVKSVFLIITKSRSDTTSQCSVIADLKCAILRWANKGLATIFTCMRGHCRRWKKDRHMAPLGHNELIRCNPLKVKQMSSNEICSMATQFQWVTTVLQIRASICSSSTMFGQ